MAIAFVRLLTFTANKTSSSTTQSGAVLNPTGANKIFVMVAHDETGQLVGITDPRGNTYAAVDSGTIGSGTRLSVWYTDNANNLQTNDVLTITFGSIVAAKSIAVVAFSGVAAGAPSATPQKILSSGGSMSVAFNQPTDATGLLISAVAYEAPDGDAISAVGALTGFTELGTTGGSATANQSLAYGYKIGPVNATAYGANDTTNLSRNAVLINAYWTVGGPTLITLTVPLLNAGASLTAPAVTTPPQVATVPLLDAAAALSAPTLAQFSPTKALTVPLLDASPALSGPTIVQPPQALALPQLVSTDAEYAPTLAPAPVSLTAPLLTEINALYAPTAVPLAPVLDYGPWSPTWSNLFSGSQALTVPLLDAGPSLTGPAVIPAPWTLTPALLTSTSAIYVPTVILDQFLTVVLLTSTSALYAPAVMPAQTVSISLIDAANAVYAPVLYQDFFLVPPLVDSGFQLFPTTLAPGPVAVSLGQLNAAATLSAPNVSLVGGVTQGLTLPTIDASGGAGFSPASITGLAVRLDPSTLSWANAGSGPAITIFGTPTPVFAAATSPTGLPVAHFAYNEGRIRSTWAGDVNDFTVLYLVRATGPNVGRAFGAQYPPSNFLVGFHTSYPDAAYDNGTWLGAGTGWNMWSSSWPGPWRMYGGDSASGGGFRFFVDGVQVGADQPVDGDLTNGWAISGYDATAGSETMDMDLAEVLIYDRKLSDVERVQVETYLQQKWITGGLVTSNLFAPSFVQFSPSKTVTVPLVDAAAALYAPAVQQAQFLTVPLLTSVATLSSPTVSPQPVAVAVPLLTSTSSLTAPVLVQVVTLPLLTSTSTLSPPSVTQVVVVPLLTSTAVVSAPTLTVGPVTVVLGLLDAAGAVYAPALTKVGGGVQAVTLPRIGGDSTPSYATRVASLAPVSHWRLGEPSGTVAVDQMAFHDAAYTGSPTLGVAGLLTGDADTAMQVAGVTNQGADVGNGVAYQLDVLTVEAWVKTSGAGAVYRSIVVKQLAFGLFAIDGVVTVYEWSGGGNQGSGVNINDGVRHHVVAALAPSVGSQIYIDGVAAGPAFTHLTNNHSTSLNIGYNAATGQEFIGVIDEVAYYGRVLTPAEVAGNYQAGITGAVVGTDVFAPGLVQLAPAQNISPPLLDAAAAVYAPALLQARFLTVPLLTSTATLSAPTLQAVVAVPLLTSTSVLSPPAVVPLVAVPLLTSTSVLSAPTLTVGPVAVAVPLLASTSAVYAPTVVQGVGGTQALTLTLVDAAGVIYAPALAAVGGATQPVALPLLSAVGAAPFSPSSVTGLAIWLDASTLAPGALTVWPNLANAALPGTMVYQTAYPAVVAGALNGLPAVRFAYAQGRLRISGTGIVQNWTVAYVARMYGPNAGRVATGILPPNNMLLGFWNGNQDVMYDNGFADNSYLPVTTNWKLYSGDGTTTGPRSRLFSNGVYLGQVLTCQGWGGTFALSGYAPTTEEETCDTDVAEVVMYDRPLSDTERVQVEDYLRTKWLGAGAGADPLFAPSFVQFSPPQTVVLPLVDAGSALYAPTVLPQPVTLTVPLLTSVSSLSSPTLLVGPVAVAVPLLTSVSVLSPPLLYLDQFLTPPLLDAGPALYAPDLTSGVTVAPQTLVSTAAVYAPTLVFPTKALTLPMLESVSASAWSPATITSLAAWLDATQDVGVFADGTDIFYYTEHSPAHTSFQAQSGQAPTFRTSIAGMPRLDFHALPAGGAALGIGPALGTPGWTAPPAGLTFVMVMRSTITGFGSYAMFITSQGGGSSRGYEMRSEGGAFKDQIVIDYTTYGIVFSNPWIYTANEDHLHVLRVKPTVGAESWVDGHYQQGGAVPSMSGLSGNLWFGRRDDGYLLNAIVGEALVFGDAISDTDLANLTAYLNYKWLGTGSPPAGTAAEPLFAPGFVQLSAPQTITVPLLDAGPATYTPTLSANIALPLVTSASALYAPAVTQAVALPLLTSTSVLSAPVLSSSITAAFLDAGAAVYAPSVKVTVALPFIDAGPAVYAPALLPGQVVLTVPLLVSTAVLTSPTVTPAAVSVSLGFLGRTTNWATVANGAVATASSTWDPGGAPFAPSKMIDELDSAWVSAVNNVTNQWGRVDLGQARTVNAFRIYNSNTYINTFNVQSSPDDSNWTTRGTGSSPGDTGVVAVAPTTARYWRILFTSSNNTGNETNAFELLLDLGPAAYAPVPTQSTTVALPLLAVTGAFAPTSVAGLGLWLEADAITGVTNGTAFATWPDLSPAGRHAVAVTAGAIYRSAGPAVDFMTDADRRMRIPGVGSMLASLVGSTTFLVTTIRTTSNYNVLLTGPTNALWQWLIENTLTGGWYFGNKNASYRMYNTTRTPNVRRVTTFRDRDDAGRADLFENGVQDTSYSVPSNDFELVNAAYTFTDILIGGYFDGSLAFDGQVHAVLFYDRALTEPERVQVEQYLAYKWMGGAAPGGDLLFAPGFTQLAPQQTVDVPQLFSFATLYPPVVPWSQPAVIPFLDSGPTLSAPTLVIGSPQTTVLPQLVSTSSLSPPTIVANVPVTATYWTTPADNVPVTAVSPVFRFTMPASIARMHFEMQLDDNPAFSSPTIILSSADQTGWEYWNFSAWVPVPAAGVNPTYSGNEARHTLQTPLTGPVYRRVRAGIRLS